MTGPYLVKFKWRWWRHVINFICIYLHSMALVLAFNLGVSDMAIWHDQTKQLPEGKQRESKTSIPETELCRWVWHQEVSKVRSHGRGIRLSMWQDEAWKECMGGQLVEPKHLPKAKDLGWHKNLRKMWHMEQLAPCTCNHTSKITKGSTNLTRQWHFKIFTGATPSCHMS